MSDTLYEIDFRLGGGTDGPFVSSSLQGSVDVVRSRFPHANIGSVELFPVVCHASDSKRNIVAVIRVIRQMNA